MYSNTSAFSDTSFFQADSTTINSTSSINFISPGTIFSNNIGIVSEGLFIPNLFVLNATGAATVGVSNAITVAGQIFADQFSSTSDQVSILAAYPLIINNFSMTATSMISLVGEIESKTVVFSSPQINSNGVIQADNITLLGCTAQLYTGGTLTAAYLQVGAKGARCLCNLYGTIGNGNLNFYCSSMNLATYLVGLPNVTIDCISLLISTCTFFS